MKANQTSRHQGQATILLLLLLCLIIFSPMAVGSGLHRLLSPGLFDSGGYQWIAFGELIISLVGLIILIHHYIELNVLPNFMSPRIVGGVVIGYLPLGGPGSPCRWRC